MMFDIEDNFTTNGSDGNYSDGNEREDFPLINLYLALPLRVIMSLAIIISASIVLLAIKKSKRTTFTLHFFFIANLMIADIGVAVIHNGAAILNIILIIVNPNRQGMDCKIIAVTAFPDATDTMMLTALCFDRLYSVTAPHHYRRNMTKRKGFAIAFAIWLLSLPLGFLIFADPYLSNRTEGSLCSKIIYNIYEIAIILLSLLLSAAFVVILNVYLYCIVVKTTPSHRISNKRTGRIKEALRTLKETKTASIILVILTGATILFAILRVIVYTILRSQVEDSMIEDIIYSLIMPLIYNVDILLHSILYGYFLHSIGHSLGFDICQSFCTSATSSEI